jgi:hypothetical protein
MYYVTYRKKTYIARAFSRRCRKIDPVNLFLDSS